MGVCCRRTCCCVRSSNARSPQAFRWQNSRKPQSHPSSPLWAVTLAVYVLSMLLDVMPDLQRFHRQQVYLLGVAPITSAVLLQVSKILSRKVRPDKLR